MMAEPPRLWLRGQQVRITHKSGAFDGTIMLASENGKSLAATMPSDAGFILLSWHEEAAEYRCLLCNQRVQVEPKDTAS